MGNNLGILYPSLDIDLRTFVSLSTWGAPAGLPSRLLQALCLWTFIRHRNPVHFLAEQD